MSFDKRKSLIELEGVRPEGPSFGSSILNSTNKLYEKPLCEFTVEDLRLMIGQGAELRYLIPLAIEHMKENPFAPGDYYRGDLLWSVLNVEKNFWEDHREAYWQMYELVAEMPEILGNLIKAIVHFKQHNP
jgi:hypothetical protein